MTTQKSSRFYSVSYLGSYVTHATQEWPLGAPTERDSRLLQAAKRSKDNRNQKFDCWLPVSSTGLHLSATGNAVEYPLTTVHGCNFYWPAPASLTNRTIVLERRGGLRDRTLPGHFQTVHPPWRCGGHAAVSSVHLPTGKIRRRPLQLDVQANEASQAAARRRTAHLLFSQILNQAGSFSRGPLSPIAISILCTLNDFILCVVILSLFIQLFWRWKYSFVLDLNIFCFCFYFFPIER